MKLEVLREELTVCQVCSPAELDLTKELYFLGKTKEEWSLVCPTEQVPKETLARDFGRASDSGVCFVHL